MAEIRRIELKSVSVPKENKKDKKVTLVSRFSLALGETTATTFPEFSFIELVKKEKVIYYLLNEILLKNV